MLLKLSSFTVSKAFQYGYQFLLFSAGVFLHQQQPCQKCLFVLVCFTPSTCTQVQVSMQFGLNVCTLQCLVAVLEKFFIDYNFVFHRLGEENRRVLASALPLLLCHLQRLVLELLSLKSQLAAKRNILELLGSYNFFKGIVTNTSIKGTVLSDQIRPIVLWLEA